MIVFAGAASWLSSLTLIPTDNSPHRLSGGLSYFPGQCFFVSSNLNETLNLTRYSSTLSSLICISCSITSAICRSRSVLEARSTAAFPAFSQTLRAYVLAVQVDDVIGHQDRAAWPPHQQ